MGKWFDSKAVFVPIQHASQIALCAWGGYYSYIAITKLRSYEEATKKAAKWSKAVEEHLNKTRTTQAAGAVAIILSMSTAIMLLLFRDAVPSLAVKAASPAMLAVVTLSRSYIKNYWAPYKDKDGKDIAGTRVPLPNMEDYNEAERRTEDLLGVLEYLEYSWLISLTGLFFGALPSKPGTIRAPWNEL